MGQFIAFFTNVQNLLSLGVGVLVFATLVTLLSSLGQGAGLDNRMKAVSVRREELKRRSRQAIAQSGQGGLRHTDEGFKKRVVEQLNLTKLLEDPRVADKMAQAGYRGPKPLTTFYFFRFSMPFILFAVAVFYLFVFNDFGLALMMRLTICMVAAVIGFYAPNIFLANRIAKRKTSIMQAFPDALDLLLICVEAGMSIESAIQKVSQEIGGSSIDLAEELTLLSAELSYLPDRRLAYEGLAKRTNHPGVKSVATAMTQAETYGTPLGAALRTMAKENRELRLSAAEKKAAALPAKLTVPMILFFLPVLFIVILTPAIISIQDTMAKGG
ncbi:type II secretion system F family protein [Brevundimonas sp. M20]|uniref:type II secretion system F family protein n=1 Tax=Brevundimonas sp. M20 TaxID=2591463 RepID=UPI001146A8A3|nr:type II secretion system F family protein [Brevundimonas sp. M20]QDH74621.1 type II secretion system F family protein [Brevundimonas sp. M20]